MNIQQLAELYASSFQTKTRKNDTNFICLKDDCKDEQLTDLIHTAHNDFMPDDYKYRFVHEALEKIAEGNPLDEINIEPDIYNRDLLAWVSSNLTRASYIDDAIENAGYKDFYSALMDGQYLEKVEVLQSVYSSLEKIIEGKE